MILRAIKDFKDYDIEVDLERSYVISDSEKDIILAKAVGLKVIKIGGYSPIANITKKSLLEAARAILECD